MARFGPAGNPDAFALAGFKASADMPAWLQQMGLDAYEYQCTRGVKIGEETARVIGTAALKHNVKLSIHAPYYISLATDEAETAVNTRKHFLKSLQVAQWMGADTVVFHMGGAGKKSRAEAMEKAKRLFAEVLSEIDKCGLSGIKLAPETRGKQNQLGTIPEILELCKMEKRVVPAIDFGHLHAVSGGSYTSMDEYERVFYDIGTALGAEVANNLHIHFSRIEFTKAGEKRHWTFSDAFGPPHEPLLEAIVRNGYSPRIICESAGTQASDAKIMKETYNAMLNR